MNKRIEVKPNVKKDETFLCPICKSIINRNWEKKGMVYIACEEGHVFEVSEVKGK